MGVESPRQRSSCGRLKCSVVLCTYNGAAYLEPQIASLMSQDRPPDQIVISDDRSTDGTWEMLHGIKSGTHTQILLRRNPENVGFVQNFGQAIELAEGDVIFLCDQDDIWLPDKISTYERAFLEYPYVAMVFSDADLIDAEGRALRQTAWARDVVGFTPDQKRAWESEPDAALRRLIQNNVVTGSTMAFRSKYRDLILPMPDWASHGIPHDTWIALILAAVAPTLPLSAAHSLYRIHPDQRLGLASAQPTRRGQHNRVLEEIRSRLRLVVDRLVEHQGQFNIPAENVALVQGKVDHLSARLDLHGSSRRRFPIVWQELRLRHYQQFSSGYRSAVLDLFPWARDLTALPWHNP